MLVRYCDRCGAKIESNEKHESVYIKVANMQDKNVDYVNDLCCNCSKKFIRFLKGGELIDGI